MTTQTWSLPAAANTFANSRPKWNDTAEALRAMHEGPSAPTTTTAYMLWVDTTNNLLKQRNAADTAWITIMKIGVTNGGLVSLSESGQAFTVDVSMGGFKLTNLGAPSGALDAARKQEQDLKAPLASPSFTGQAAINADPIAGTALTRRSWIEANYVDLTGSTMTGRLGVPSSPAAAAGEALRKDEIEALVSFDTSTGHNHDGSNSRLVTFPHQKLITPVQKASLSASTGYVTVDITADVTPDTARAAILSVALSAAVTASTSSGELWLRKKGETAEGIYLRDYKSTPNAITVTSITDFFVIVDVDSAEQFEYKFTETGVASCVIDLRGYITLD